jgi:hypothetical protein
VNFYPMSDEEMATDRRENEGGHAFGEMSGESFSSSPANNAQVGAGSNNSQHAPNAFFLKLSNIEQQFIPVWPTIGWKPKKLLLAG